VLGNILLASDNARLRLSATNLELGITCWIGAKIEEEGSTTVPAKTLVDLVNTLPQDKVEMSLVVRTQTLNLSCGRVQANIKGIDAQEFPLIPPANLDDALQLNVEDFREMINHVIFAAATDEARPILTGVLAKIEGGQVTLAAADGFRLSLRTAHLSTPNAEPIQAIIPARALAELGRVITAEEPVFMSLPPGRGRSSFITTAWSWSRNSSRALSRTTTTSSPRTTPRARSCPLRSSARPARPPTSLRARRPTPRG
jgi:DNA polymerase-3 subunit beta